VWINATQLKALQLDVVIYLLSGGLRPQRLDLADYVFPLIGNLEIELCELLVAGGTPDSEQLATIK
jgi:hypothetical protein